MDWKENATGAIKPIYLELPVYEALGTKVSDEGDILGRKAIKAKIKNLVFQTNNRKGAYLITGYRGMGKTRLVKDALEEQVEKRRYKMLSISMSLGHEDLKDMDIMRGLCRNLSAKFQEYYYQSAFYGWWLLRHAIAPILAITITSIVYWIELLRQLIPFEFQLVTCVTFLLLLFVSIQSLDFTQMMALASHL